MGIIHTGVDLEDLLTTTNKRDGGGGAEDEDKAVAKDKRWSASIGVESIIHWMRWIKWI